MINEYEFAADCDGKESENNQSVGQINDVWYS